MKKIDVPMTFSEARELLNACKAYGREKKDQKERLPPQIDWVATRISEILHAEIDRQN